MIPKAFSVLRRGAVALLAAGLLGMAGCTDETPGPDAGIDLGGVDTAEVDTGPGPDAPPEDMTGAEDQGPGLDTAPADVPPAEDLPPVEDVQAPPADMTTI